MSLVSVNIAEVRGDIGALVAAYESLPKNIAKKHLMASMKRAIVKANGVQVLRELTPPEGKAKRGRRSKSAGRSTGALKRAVTTQGRYYGTNKSGVAVGVLGYKYVRDRKAIWMEFGTAKITPRGMVKKAMARIAGTAKNQLCTEMAAAFVKACNEAAKWRAKKAARLRGLR